MDKLILYVASSEEEQQWCMHAIEITSLMLREQVGENKPNSYDLWWKLKSTSLDFTISNGFSIRQTF